MGHHPAAGTGRADPIRSVCAGPVSSTKSKAVSICMSRRTVSLRSCGLGFSCSRSSSRCFRPRSFAIVVIVMNLQFYLTTRSPHLAFRRSCASAGSFRSSTRKSRLIVNSGLRNAGLVRCSRSKSAGLVPTRVRDQFLIGHYQAPVLRSGVCTDQEDDSQRRETKCDRSQGQQHLDCRMHAAKLAAADREIGNFPIPE